MLGTPIAVTNGSHFARDPALVWDGSAYALAWTDARNQSSHELYFARLDASGAKVGGDVRGTNAPGWRHQPIIAWSGAEYGIAWTDSNPSVESLEGMFARLDAQGTKVGSDTRLTSGGSRTSWVHSFVWSGQAYAVGRGLESAGSAGNEVPSVVRFACP